QTQIADASPLKNIKYKEVPSSTDWNVSTANGVFTPNLFVEVLPQDVAIKIEAIGMDKDVLRKSPHPRTEQAIMALATVRGSQAGVILAEAFQTVFELGV
ncbi:MAG: PIG-L family deacetylase, partial [Lachnospiraceae bacterium]|nr:PIG-L family deacetylase [Lachnospiraceae bacterium]